MINQQMKDIVANHSVGMVGTVNTDGTPNVSPKGTMVVVDNSTIIFGEIRSPHTLQNILHGSAVEINFVDVLARRCFRAKGHATVIAKGSEEFEALFPHFARWGELSTHIRNIIKLDVKNASIVSSPAYDVGQTEEQLRAQWKAHYASL